MTFWGIKVSACGLGVGDPIRTTTCPQPWPVISPQHRHTHKVHLAPLQGCRGAGPRLDPWALLHHHVTTRRSLPNHPSLIGSIHGSLPGELNVTEALMMTHCVAFRRQVHENKDRLCCTPPPAAFPVPLRPSIYKPRFPACHFKTEPRSWVLVYDLSP